MTETFKMDNAYRQTDEYKAFMEIIKKDAPWMPDGLAEYCIIAHKSDPQAYKKAKNAKKILSEPIKQPVHKGEVVIHDAIQVGELTPEIEKQREEFWEKYAPKEESLATIQEVEA